MHNQLQKALELSKKTGDRIIVYDPTAQSNTFVLLGLDEYEKLIIGKSEVRGLTEDELLDKINRDIAIWKSEQFVDVFDPIIREEPLNRKPAFTRFDEVLEKKNYDEFSNFSEKQEKKQTKNHWVIPSTRKEAADEVIEEDRQYLENIDF